MFFRLLQLVSVCVCVIVVVVVVVVVVGSVEVFLCVFLVLHVFQAFTVSVCVCVFVVMGLGGLKAMGGGDRTVLCMGWSMLFLSLLQLSLMLLLWSLVDDDPVMMV